MAIEKRWEAIPTRLFTSDGTADGLVTIASTDGFKTKQTVILKNNTGANLALEVKRVVSETELLVGPPGKISDRSDISAFTTALNSTIEAPEQVRPAIPDKEFERAAYEEEPVVAKRAILVDKLGRKIDSTVGDDGLVRLATTSDINVENINVENLDVQMDAFGTPPDSALSVGSENGQVSGTKHVHRVDSDLDLRVGLSNGANKAGVDASGKLSVKDVDAQSLLNSVVSALASTLKVDDDQSQVLLNAIVTALGGTLNVDDNQTQAILSSILTQLQFGGMAIGTENGQPTGTQHVFVNNLRKMVMDSHDRESDITWLDLANKKLRRIDKIEYTSATFPGVTVRKQFSYTLVGNEYVRTSPGDWSIV